MIRFLRYVLSIVAVLAALAYGWLVYSTEKNFAVAAPEALEALSADAAVEIDVGDWLIMRPGNATPSRGVIIYPGANCDIRGYAPIVKEIARAGYLTVTVSMPFDFALFAPSRADEVRAAHPEISDWVIIGHSMGGAMAGSYVHDKPDGIAGIIFWDAYPPGSKSLHDAPFPVAHIHRADENGRAPQMFLDRRSLFPENSQWVGVPGGAHMYFGSFIGGGYVESREPTIPRSEQHDIVIRATLAALAEM